MIRFLSNLLFPPKCILCRKLLDRQETDLCTDCRKHAPDFNKPKSGIPLVAQWTALWYYKDNVRGSIHRFKFGRARHYAAPYGRMLAMRIAKTLPEDFDILTWVPTGTLRKMRRGYDQAMLLAEATAAELGVTPRAVLKKIRNTPPQSGIRDAAKRRANIFGAYRVIDKNLVIGKRILLLDDVITTGATCSECARVLLTAGAKTVYCAAVAAASHDKK